MAYRIVGVASGASTEHGAGRPETTRSSFPAHAFADLRSTLK
jgi:hypothetical protein